MNVLFSARRTLNRGHPGKEYVGKMVLHADSKSLWSWGSIRGGGFGVWDLGRGRACEGEGELKRERERVHVRGRGSVSCEGERERVRSLF